MVTPMLPRRPSQIFRSRWAALLWAGGVIWAAVSVAGVDTHAHPSATNAASADSDEVPVNQADVALLRNIIGN